MKVWNQITDLAPTRNFHFARCSKIVPYNEIQPRPWINQKGGHYSGNKSH